MRPGACRVSALASARLQLRYGSCSQPSICLRLACLLHCVPSEIRDCRQGVGLSAGVSARSCCSPLNRLSSVCRDQGLHAWIGWPSLSSRPCNAGWPQVWRLKPSDARHEDELSAAAQPSTRASHQPALWPSQILTPAASAHSGRSYGRQGARCALRAAQAVAEP